MTVDPIKLTSLLRGALPENLKYYAPLVSLFIQDIHEGNMSQADIQSKLEADGDLNAAYESLFKVNVKQKSGFLSFGKGSNLGDVKTGDLVGGNKYNITIKFDLENYSLLPDEEEKKRKQKVECQTLLSLGLKALLTGDLWEARRLFEQILSIDPYFPKAQEMLHTVTRQIERTGITERNSARGKLDAHTKRLVIEEAKNIVGAETMRISEAISIEIDPYDVFRMPFFIYWPSLAGVIVGAITVLVDSMTSHLPLYVQILLDVLLSVIVFLILWVVLRSDRLVQELLPLKSIIIFVTVFVTVYLVSKVLTYTILGF